MNKKEIQIRIEELRKEIIENDLAYANGTPVITDTEYDRKYYELVDLETANPEFYNIESPTQKIYDVEVEGLQKVKHNIFVGSQEKVHTEYEIRAFLSTLPIDAIILMQDKLDGLTIVLRYENGVLKQGITRGRGEYGEDVTHIIRAVSNVPKRIPFDYYLELRLEGVIPTRCMEKLWENGELANARNIASGAIRTLKTNKVKETGLICVGFDIIEIENKEFNSDLDRIDFVKSLGFQFVETAIFRNNEESVKELIRFIKTYNEEVRPNLDYKIDGIVIKVDDLNLRNQLGMKNKNPKWSVAYKFEAEEYSTVLKGVEWTIGKTGLLVPNGIIDEVIIDNTRVNRASLANIDDIHRRDIRINDHVFAIKANEIIPKILRPIIEKRTGSEQVITAPTECPFCGSDIYKKGSYLYCSNHDCCGKMESKIKHFVGKTGLDIDGLGDKTVELLLEKGLVNSPYDILHIENKKDEILQLPKFGVKKFEKIINSLEKSKTAPLSKILSSLSIKNIAEDKSIKIANEFKSMDNILKASKSLNFRQVLIDIKDLGDVCADSLVEFFNKEENIKLIEMMLFLGYTMKQEVLETKESSITGKTFVITGTLSISRGEMKKYLESLGAKVTGSVSKKTDYLLLGEGEEGSTKHTKAIDLNIKIISEEELNNLIKGE